MCVLDISAGCVGYTFPTGFYKKTNGRSVARYTVDATTEGFRMIFIPPYGALWVGQGFADQLLYLAVE